MRNSFVVRLGAALGVALGCSRAPIADSEPSRTTTTAASVVATASASESAPLVVTELPIPTYALAVPLGTKSGEVKLACPAGAKQVRIDDEIACREPAPRGGIPARSGPALRLHPNGAIATEGSYEAGERTGVWVDFDDAGNVVAVKTWKKGEQDGLSITFWSNGKRQSQIEFADGKHHGTSTTWGDDGKPLAVKRYDHDRVVAEVAFDGAGNARGR